MRADVYREMARVEDTHWWFRGRRAICERVLRSLKLPADAAILDAGSGTGGNLAMLSRHGRVFAMEADSGARALADRRGIVTVAEGILPDGIPFGDQAFDLVALFDVLEHIDADAATLAALHARLKPGGHLLLTVPAFPLLWSTHDVLHHHKRRYLLAPLVQLVESAGYRVRFASYINFWLFPVIAAIRIFDRMTHGRLLRQKPDANAELTLPPPSVNRLLEAVFASEGVFMKLMRLPFGVSIVLLARKE